MKKILKRSISLAISGIFMAGAGLAFAAEVANPFNDVPASHWAYSSVKQLAKAGVIDSGNNFKGDQVITRYEMATIVAKAMTKYNTADSATKAQIDKLKAEFADELNDLGVRLKKVEDKVDNSGAQVHGIIKSYYDYSKTGDTSTNYLKQDVRFNFTGKVDENLSYRLDYLYTPNGGGGGGPYNDFRYNGNAGVSELGATLFINKVFNSNIMAIVGHNWIGPTNDNWVYSDGIKGLCLASQIGKVNVSASTGTLDVYGGNVNTKNTATIFTANTTMGKTYLGAAYWGIKNSNDTTKKITEAQVKQPLSDDILLNINAGKSNSITGNPATSGGTQSDNKQNTFYDVKLGYKNADPSKVGSYGFYVDYHNIGSNAVIDPDEASGAAGTITGLKGIRVGYEFVPFKNTIWRTYAAPSNKVIGSTTDEKSTVFRSMVFVNF